MSNKKGLIIPYYSWDKLIIPTILIILRNHEKNTLEQWLVINHTVNTCIQLLALPPYYDVLI